MTFASLIFGSTAKAKRSYRGTEKDWNRYDEPARKYMLHGDSMKKSKRWIHHREEKFKETPDWN